ncbi:Cleavage/polyadenylation specificity factor subunit 5, partial [Baffinella frigidus]
TSHRPGGRLRPGETEEQGLLRKLDNKLAPADADPPSWEVGQELAQWWRPNFDVHQYPYLPVHISRPKESRKVFLIHLPKQC